MIHWCFLLFRKRVCFQVSKPLVFVGGIEKKNLVSKKNQELEEKKLNSWRCWYFKYHGVCPLFFVPEKSRRTMKKYMACNFQLHGFCKKKTWRNSYGEFGISLINQTSGKKKRNSKVDPLPPKRVFSAGNAAVTWFSCLFFASGIWSTQTVFPILPQVVRAVSQQTSSNHNGSLPKSGGGIQHPKGGSFSFSIGTGTWQLASRSSNTKNVALIYLSSTKDKWQKEKKDNRYLGELQFQVPNVSSIWSSLWYHSCDYARKLTSATRISPRKKRETMKGLVHDLITSDATANTSEDWNSKSDLPRQAPTPRLWTGRVQSTWQMDPPKKSVVLLLGYIPWKLTSLPPKIDASKRLSQLCVIPFSRQKLKIWWWFRENGQPGVLSAVWLSCSVCPPKKRRKQKTVSRPPRTTWKGRWLSTCRGSMTDCCCWMIFVTLIPRLGIWSKLFVKYCVLKDQ